MVIHTLNENFYVGDVNYTFSNSRPHICLCYGLKFGYGEEKIFPWLDYNNPKLYDGLINWWKLEKDYKNFSDKYLTSDYKDPLEYQKDKSRAFFYEYPLPFWEVNYGDADYPSYILAMPGQVYVFPITYEYKYKDGKVIDFLRNQEKVHNFQPKYFNISNEEISSFIENLRFYNFFSSERFASDVQWHLIYCPNNISEENDTISMPYRDHKTYLKKRDGDINENSLHS